MTIQSLVCISFSRSDCTPLSLLIAHMNDEDLSTTDVLADRTKNLSNFYLTNDNDTDNVDDNDDNSVLLHESLYFTESEFADFTVQKKYCNANNLTIISLNIANLYSKLSSLKCFLHNVTTTSNKPDIVIIVETHIDEAKSDFDDESLTNIIEGYQFFHKGRKNNRGGGVGILVSNDIKGEAMLCRQTDRKVKFFEGIFENVIVRIPDCIEGSPKKDLVLVALYRQPNNENTDSFLECMANLMKTIDKPRNEIVIAGDMNLDLLKYENHLPTSKYIDIITSHKFIPRIIRPTRIKKRTATLIDHILTRANTAVEASGILDTELAGNCGYTDHKPVFTILRAKVPKKDRKALTTITYFSKEGNLSRREGLLKEDWSGILAEKNPDQIYNTLIDKYSTHYYNNLTTKLIRHGNKRHRREPWMTEEILADMRRRDRLAKQKDRRADYKKLRNDIVNRVRKAEKASLQTMVQESIGNIKEHWKVIIQTARKTNNKEELTTNFQYQGSWIEDRQTNSNNYNKYLADVGKETNESVGTAKSSPEHYLQKHRIRNEHSILLSDISAEDVIQVCKKLSPKTSADSAGFKQNIVLQDAELIAHVVAHLVNCSMKEGTCPSNSKLARVIPVYKRKGSKHLYENYRPISLLSAFSKILERLIYNKVFDFLVRYEILFESQFGFRQGHNTLHATIDFLKMIEDTLDDNEYAIGVFCDLSKAFDTINHDILLQKLDHYGIRGTAKKWFESYLTGREQYVDWNGFKSNKLPIETGVPQGSILGPLLFLLYINDLPSATRIKCVLYADDSNLLIRGKDLSIVQDNLNKELEGVNDYFKSNKLKINTKKTKLVCFRKKSQEIDYNDVKIYLDGDQLQFAEEAQFLGMTLDSHLTWDSHCKQVANKISRNSGAISRVRKLLPPDSLKLLYNSFVLPHLQYGLAAWGGCTGENKKRIVAIQKRVTRIISKAHYTSHTEPRMKKLGMLKLEELYEQQCATLLHDITYNRAPKPIKNLMTFNREVTSHSLRNHQNDPHNIRVPLAKNKISSNSFCSKGPLIWNRLPRDLKDIERKFTFKSKLKQYFLNRYTLSCDCNNPRCSDQRHHHR